MKDTTNLPDYKLAPLKAVRAADRLLSLKPKHDVWFVIAEILKMWSAMRPEEYRSHLVELKDIKATRKVSSVGGKSYSGVSKADGSYTSYLLDIPEKVVLMIRAIYSPQELPFDKNFYYKFANKFPKYKVREKI